MILDCFVAFAPRNDDFEGILYYTESSLRALQQAGRSNPVFISSNEQVHFILTCEAL